MKRLSITLDQQSAEKLARLAERTHVQPNALAQSLLSAALDQADVDPREAVEFLDGIREASSRAQHGLTQAKAGETLPLDAL